MHKSTDLRPTSSTACGGGGLSRRGFLVLGAAGVTTVLLGELFPGRIAAADAARQVRLSRYPRTPIGRLSDLIPDRPVEFRYPNDEPRSASFLVKLGRRAGGGVGPDQDVVAFNAFCTHMGGSLQGAYQGQHKVALCPLHLTTFDLTRHGIVAAGHATAHLPQVVIETQGDDLYAVGVLGLIYGTHDNLETQRRS